ncbi:MAG: hypothetical protein ACRCTY_08795 [Candidatus Adiutrix sp.]
MASNDTVSVKSLIRKMTISYFLSIFGCFGLLSTRFQTKEFDYATVKMVVGAYYLDPFYLDLISLTAFLSGFFMVIYYRKTLTPYLKHLERLGMDRL